MMKFVLIKIFKDKGIKMTTKTYIGGKTHRSVKHSPTIENEVRESLFPSLSGIIANLSYKEKELANPDQTKLDYYSKAGVAIWRVKNHWGQFTDEDIKNISAPVSRLIKAFSATNDYVEEQKIFEDNRAYFDEMIKTYL